MAFKNGNVIAVVSFEGGSIADFTQWGNVLTGVVAETKEEAMRRLIAEVDDMVADAQGRVAVRSGHLRAGIQRQQDGDDILFVAAADAASDNEDYAHFVEFGWGGGVSGASDANLYSGSGAAASPYNSPRARRAKGGAAPEPYYLPALHAGLARNGGALASAMIDVGRARGFDVR